MQYIFTTEKMEEDGDPAKASNNSYSSARKKLGSVRSEVRSKKLAG